jgi:hypothetical protein
VDGIDVQQAMIRARVEGDGRDELSRPLTWSEDPQVGALLEMTAVAFEAGLQVSQDGPLARSGGR